MRGLPGDSESGENPIMPQLIQADAASRRGLIQAFQRRSLSIRNAQFR